MNDIDQKVDEASFKLKIAEISSAFAEAKLSLIDAQQELRQKETEIAALKSLNRPSREKTKPSSIAAIAIVVTPKSSRSELLSARYAWMMAALF
ncbi:hypothetical protein WGT02_10350 [Rhizobium sp. T1470]|uniref:hypothetical protein n=1 Tax=unclassified Rhizobium TaxID=2613769 RepID=UPI001AAFB779|nr:hypothetical protein [Rhizobium sp. T1473]MCA0801653.1 hypothetical protein [Rhizobium sp. T1473]